MSYEHSATDQSSPETATRTASCACGSLRLTVRGEPGRVYACSCLECQRATGTAFAYRAIFGKAAITQIEGERRTWRRGSDSGRWVEQSFCPTCGTLVYMEGEGLTDAVSVSVGCFADPSFASPATFFRTARRHRWYEPAEGINCLE